MTSIGVSTTSCLDLDLASLAALALPPTNTTTTTMKKTLAPRRPAYKPRPADTSGVRLPEALLGATELLAENTHEVWGAGRVATGWSYGPQRDDANKTSPCLLPYHKLSNKEQEYDRRTSIETVKLITLMGWQILPPADRKMLARDTHWPSQKTYTPRPLDTAGVKLPAEMEALVDRLAENTHDQWAVGRLSEGWTLGPSRNDKLKTTPLLVPYADLSAEEKSYDINTSRETLKLLVKLGFTFERSKTRVKV